jgi:RHS repeat-associated protein
VGGNLEIVSSGGVTDYPHYSSANGRAVAVYSRKSTGTNAFSYLLSDHQSSVATITNSSGTSVVNESFTPFGARRNPSTWSGAATTSDLTISAGITREGYTFQTQLGLWMGLNHMNGRVQDTVTGRFLSPDPTIPDPGFTQSYNRYSYVNNNPLTYNDPTGFTAPDTRCISDCPDTSANPGAPDIGDDWSGYSDPLPPNQCDKNGCSTTERVCTASGCQENTFYDFYDVSPELSSDGGNHGANQNPQRWRRQAARESGYRQS